MAMTSIGSSTNFLARYELYADPDVHLLICCRPECGFALSTARSQVTSHLRDKHRVPEDLRKGLTHYLKHDHPYKFADPASVPPRPNGSDIHPKLQVHDGYACRECSYRTVNPLIISRHISIQHRNGGGISKAELNELYDDVFLQAWTRHAHGVEQQYWVVRKNGSLTRPVADRETYALLRSTHQREQDRLETDAQAREHGTRDTGSKTLVASRPWMDRTRWAITYDGVRRDILIDLAAMPYGGADHALGERPSNGASSLISPREDEQRLVSLVAGVDRMLDRCEETMLHTSRNLLCWLRSTKPQTCYPKPFALVSLKASKTKYRRYFKRFIAFVFRAYRMPPDARRLLQIRFKKRELSQLQAIWEHGAWDNSVLDWGLHAPLQGETEREEEGEDGDEEEEEEEEEEEAATSWGGEKSDSDGEWEEEEEEEEEEEGDRGTGTGDVLNGPTSQLLELLFKLSMTFSMAQFLDAQPSSSLLVYFSGVLGFSSDSQDFLPAKKYTPCLSGLIYIQRLLFLEYALPLRAYPHLRIPRRSRLRQYERFDGVRLRYMITGSQSPLEEFQSLRDFGRVIARTDAPAFLLRWSDDGETVSYGDEFHLTMQDFRGLAEYFTVQAEELCEELMYDLDPVVDLASVKDDLTNTRSGFSFVKHPDNGLVDAYLDLSVKACTTRRKRLSREGRWDWEAIFSYRAKAEGLDEMLLGGLHTAGGQVPRAPELLGLEIQNGPSTERGVYVWNGFMVYLTRHHKAKRSNNREFYVVRFLPARLGRVMYKYLVYIRPFLDMLQRERDTYYKEVVPTRLLFRSGRDLDRPWDAARLTAILRKATTEVWGRPVNSQLYRQLTIGITEKHVQEVHKPFNRFDDVKAGANRNVAFAWQSGHRPLQRATTYGLDGAFPARLQPALLRLYEWASTRWHEFLHQPSKVMPRARPAAVRERARSPSPPFPHSPDARPRLVKRKTLPWSGDEPHEARPIKRSARPGHQAPSGVNNVQCPLSEPRFIDDPDESNEVYNPLIDRDRPRQDSPKYPVDVIVSGRRLHSYRAMIERVVEHLERHLQLCALCCSWPQLPHSHTLQDCTDADSECIRGRWARMEEGIRYEDNKTICPHCCLRVLDCTDPSRPHHDGYGLDWDCRYRGVITALVAKAFFAQSEEETLEMLGRWMRRDGITLSNKVGWGAWPGQENERVVHKWLGQSVIWFGVKVPRILQVFFQLAEDSKNRYEKMRSKGWL